MKRWKSSFSSFGFCAFALSGSVIAQSEAEFFVCKPDSAVVDGERVNCNPASAKVSDLSDQDIFLEPCRGSRIPKDRMEASASEYRFSLSHPTRGNKSTVTESITISRADGSFLAKERQVYNSDGDVLGTVSISGSCEIETRAQKF